MYKQEVHYKCSIFIQRLAEVGLTAIEAHKYSPGDSDFNDLRTFVWVDEGGTFVKATLFLHGKDVAFIEFGAGVHYNGAGGESPNPYGAPLGMIIGSYGLGHGLEDHWFYRDSETGESKMSHGTEAAMPMYHASVKIREKNSFLSIAREVFSK